MPMTIELSELSQRILVLLDELEYDNVVAIFNTIVVRPSPGDIPFESYKAALIELLGKNMARLSFTTDLPYTEQVVSGDRAHTLVQSIETEFRFDTSVARWTFADDDPGSPRLSLHLSPEGFEAARPILDARGDRWWRA